VANLFARLHPKDVAGVLMLEATALEDVSLLKRQENALQRGLAWAVNHLLPMNSNHETLHTSQSVTEIACAPAFPALPLRVVTVTKPAMAWATKSGHFPQFTEPKLVTSSIQELTATAQ
jgi:hypothetical protein